MATSQPHYHFENFFAPLPGENILQQFECEEGCSRCCGPKTFIALTDNRLIVRDQAANQCCCCCAGPHFDTAVYLRDIQVLKESGQQQQSCLVHCISAFLTCQCICFLLTCCCASCCGSCCGDLPKVVSFRGSYGTQVLTFKSSDAFEAVNKITQMIQPFKSMK